MIKETIIIFLLLVLAVSGIIFFSLRVVSSLVQSSQDRYTSQREGLCKSDCEVIGYKFRRRELRAFGKEICLCQKEGEIKSLWE